MIEYKSGASNRVADALSRLPEGIQDKSLAVLALFARPGAAILDLIREENTRLPDLVALHQAVANGSCNMSHIMTVCITSSDAYSSVLQQFQPFWMSVTHLQQPTTRARSEHLLGW